MAARRHFRRRRPRRRPSAGNTPSPGEGAAPPEGLDEPSPSPALEPDVPEEEAAGQAPPAAVSSPPPSVPSAPAARAAGPRGPRGSRRTHRKHPAPERIKEITCKGPFGGTLQSGPARPVRASGLADEHLDRGNVYAERGIWDEALDNFKKSVEITPEFAEGHNNYGVCCIYTQRYEEAIKALSSAAKHFPGWPVALANLGLSYQHAGKTDQAVAYYRQSLNRKRDQPQVWVALGMLQETRGETDAALDSYRNAVSFAPKYDLGLLCLGMLLARRGQVDEAERLLKAALEVEPTMAQAAATLGAIEAGRGRLREARERFLQAKKVRPERIPGTARRGLLALKAYRDGVGKGLLEMKSTMPETGSVAQCRFALALAYIAADDLPAAQESFEIAAKEAPEWFEPHQWLGFLAALDEDTEKARRAWNQALELRPDDSLLREQMGLLCLAVRRRKEGAAHLQVAKDLGRQVAVPSEILAAEESVVGMPAASAPASSAGKEVAQPTTSRTNAKPKSPPPAASTASNTGRASQTRKAPPSPSTPPAREARETLADDEIMDEILGGEDDDIEEGEWEELETE